VFRLLMLSLVIVMATGCVPAYVQPESGETATFTMETSSGDVQNLWFYRYPGDMDEYRCSKEEAEGIAILNNIGVVSSYADQGRNVKKVTIKLPADRPFRFGAQIPTYELTGTGVFELTWCQLHARFVPRSGAHYVVVQGAEGNLCSFRIFEEDLSGGRTKPEIQLLPECFDKKNGNGIWEEGIKDQYEKDPGAYR